MSINNKIKIPCVYYYYLHYKLKEVTKNNCMSLKDTKVNMFLWRIPSSLRTLILKEMEKLNLIKIEDNKMVVFLDSDFDINMLGRYFKEMGLF